MHEPFPLSGRLSGFEADTMPWLIGIFSRRALCASPLPAGARSRRHRAGATAFRRAVALDVPPSSSHVFGMLNEYSRLHPPVGFAGGLQSLSCAAKRAAHALRCGQRAPDRCGGASIAV